MNRIVLEWKKSMQRSVAAGAVVTAFLSFMTLLGTLASPWVALGFLPVAAVGGMIIIPAVIDYRRNMAVWLSLPDEMRRRVDTLCAEERQTAYCRLLRGYLTPYGMLLREGFFAWEHIVSIGFWEKGRKFSRAVDWWNFLSGAVSLFGNSSGDYVDPESPAQCRITVREGERERLCQIPLDPQSFADGGVEMLIGELKKVSPVALTFR
jgi:hypothetical protein